MKLRVPSDHAADWPLSQRSPDVAPPPQYDRLRAPVWTPPPAAPARAGALNHKDIESRGFRC